jgi:hypothetical protein
VRENTLARQPRLPAAFFYYLLFASRRYELCLLMLLACSAASPSPLDTSTNFADALFEHKSQKSVDQAATATHKSARLPFWLVYGRLFGLILQSRESFCGYVNETI